MLNLNQITTNSVAEFRRILILSIIYAVVGMIMLALQQHEVVIFLEAFFLIPLILSPFIGSFGKTLTALITAVVGTMWGATTLAIAGQSVNGVALSITLAVSSMINMFIISDYSKHRMKNTVIDAVNNSFQDHFAPIYGGYVVLAIAFALPSLAGQEWMLVISALLLHNMISTTITLPASVNLYEHYMAQRAITKLENKVLKLITKFGSEQQGVPILASWLGAGVEEVTHAIENLRSKHYIVSNRFFYPSNSLMWFVGILAPLVGYVMANLTLPEIIPGLALIASSVLIIFGLSVQRSWWLKEIDRLITHLMGFSAIGLGLFLSLAISVNYALILLLCSLLGIVVCYLPEKRFHTARLGASLFYVLEFMAGWFANIILGTSGLVYSAILFGVIIADVYLAKEEKYVRI